MVLCWVLYGFIAAANIVGYLATRYDKRASRLQRRADPPQRISERMLWAVAGFGGFLGVMLAMGRFRHKTRKRSFQFVLFVAAFVSTIVWVGWLMALDCLPIGAI